MIICSKSEKEFEDIKFNLIEVKKSKSITK